MRRSVVHIYAKVYARPDTFIHYWARFASLCIHIYSVYLLKKKHSKTGKTAFKWLESCKSVLESKRKHLHFAVDFTAKLSTYPQRARFDYVQAKSD